MKPYFNPIRTVLAIALMITGCLTPPISASTVEVFFLAGQSNADGSNSYWNGTPGKGPALSAENMHLATPYSGVMYAQTHVNPFSGSPPLHYYTDPFGPLQPASWGMMGPELSLGRSLDAVFDNQVAIIKYTAPGTSLNAQWGPDDNLLYSDMLNYFENRLSELSADFTTVNLRGFFWHQGESDAGPPHAENYAENFMAMYDPLRQALGNAAMPAVLGLINESFPGTTPPNANVITLNNEILSLALSDPTIATTGSMNDLPLYDGIHFDSNGQVVHGERMADAYIANFATVPEPASSLLVIAAMGLVFGQRRRIMLPK